jgi:excinuclease ABC subunit C
MNLKSIPLSPGVYIFRDKNKNILYVGKAINLKSRVSSYFQKNILSPKTKQMVNQIGSIETIKTTSEFDALLLEARLIKKHQPKYNVISRDDKHPLYIKVTKEEYPKIATVRRENDNKSLYFGPFPSSRTVRDTLRYLRTIFPYCTDKHIKKKPCFYSFLELCSPCPNTIEQLPPEEKQKKKKRYRRNIFQMKRILEGKSLSVLKDLEKEMSVLSKKEYYKDAATIKKKFDKLLYLISPRFSPSVYLDNPNLYNDIREQELTSLGKILSIEKPVRIEGYDISNISGKSATGSMVVFIDGEPDKNKYRRFKVKSKNTPDDFYMMREIVTRRLTHLDWDLPNVFLIDGGVGQVSTVVSVLEEKGIFIPIIGLAKRFEEIIVPNKHNNELTFTTIRIPIGSGALSLLQRIRDESHRFARIYHHLLRKKEMLY